MDLFDENDNYCESMDSLSLEHSKQNSNLNRINDIPESDTKSKIKNIKKGLVARRIFISLSKDRGLYGEYKSEEGEDRCFYLNNEYLGLPSSDILLEQIGKIYLPKTTNFYDKRNMAKTPWHLTIDKTEYFGNSEPEFFQKIFSILKIKEIEKFISRKIG